MVQCEEVSHRSGLYPIGGAHLAGTQPVMPVRFRTIKLINYAIRKLGGALIIQNFTYTLQLPGAKPQGPFNRAQLISWANQHLP